MPAVASPVLPAETSILAIDTAMDRCSVALLQGTDLMEREVNAPREHTQRILPMVESLLADSGLTLGQLSAIAISIGPGSFTGLRIGLSVAQGLAYGADLPLIPVSTLETMARGAVRCFDLKPGDRLLPAIDARMDEIYWAAYELNTADSSQGVLSTNHAEAVAHPSRCYDYLTSMIKEASPYVAVGSGWRYYEQKPGQHCIQHHVDFSSTAQDVVVLAAEAFSKGQLREAMEVEPTYLRNEISWQKRQRIRD